MTRRRNAAQAPRVDKSALFFRWFERTKRDDPPSLFAAFKAGMRVGRRLQRLGE